MPSLAVIQAAEDRFGLTVFSTLTATTYEILDHLGLGTQVLGVGSLLAGGINAAEETSSLTVAND